MSLPRWLINLLEDHFTPQQVATLAQHWWTYNGFSLSNATREQLLDAARTTLQLRSAQ